MKKTIIFGILALITLLSVQSAKADIELCWMEGTPPLVHIACIYIPEPLDMTWCDAVYSTFRDAYNSKIGDTRYNARMDFTGDGKINLSDFAYFGHKYYLAKNGSQEARIWCAYRTV